MPLVGYMHAQRRLTEAPRGRLPDWQALLGPVHWSGVTPVSVDRQLGKGKSKFLLLELCDFGWICARPVVPHRDAQEPPARVRLSGGQCARVA